MDDIFNLDYKESEPCKMKQQEFFDKTKVLLYKLYNEYSKALRTRMLEQDEYPDESICDKCTGCGKFGDGDECYLNNDGYCVTRFCDYEQVGLQLEYHLDDIFELLEVDEIYNI